MCQVSGGGWSGQYEELIEMDCGPDHVCVETMPRLPACVLAPAERCDPETYVGRCDGNEPIVCRTPNDWTSQPFVMSGGECLSGWRCTVESRQAACRPPAAP
jgi:hypothetical protein